MPVTDTDVRMRRAELFHTLRAPDACWLAIRVDGRAFHTWVDQAGYDRPFDDALHQRMAAVATALVDNFDGRYGYTESDECSLVVGPDFDLFDREVEKLVSLTAATATAAFNAAAPLPDGTSPATFDSRVVVLPTLTDVVDYLAWRQDDAWRCCVNATAYWAARADGMSARAATRATSGPASVKHEFLHERGINAAALPAWQRRGTGVYHETYTKTGVDPRDGSEHVALRRRLVVNDELTYGDEYRAWLAEQLMR